MKRSGFKQKTLEDYKPMRRTPMQRSTKPLKRSRMKPHRRSPEEIGWREEVLKRADYRCQWVDQQTMQRCEVRGKENLDSHHIAKRSQRPDLKGSLSNGVALCRLHHSFSDTVEGQKQARGQGLLGGETYEKAMKDRLLSLT